MHVNIKIQVWQNQPPIFPSKDLEDGPRMGMHGRCMDHVDLPQGTAREEGWTDVGLGRRPQV